MIFLTLFCIFATVQSEIHNLHYIYTALSKPISQPGVYQFTAMEILNGRAIDFCNSTDKVKMPLQKWMEEHTKTDYSLKGIQSRRRMEQWFDFSIKFLMEHMQQNKPDPDVRILQWMHGCLVKNTTDGKLKFYQGFHQYGFDGENFLSFDIKNTVWVAAATAAKSTKKKWDESAFGQHTKEYLETDCVHWLEKLLKFQEQDFQTFSPPEVHIFSKKSTSPDYRTLVCLATGFYPRDVSVNILKDGVLLAESDGVASSGVRPNGDRKQTYQLRKWLEIEASDTSKYSCRIHHRTLQSPIEESWDGKCCNCDSDNTGAIVGGVVVLLIVLVTVLVGLYFLRKKINAAQAPANQTLTGNGLACESTIPSPGNGLDCESTIPSPELETEGSVGEDSGNGLACESTIPSPELETEGSVGEDSGNGLACESMIPSSGVKLETEGLEGSVESEDSACESSVPSPELETEGSVGEDCGRGSTTSSGPKEEVNEPSMVIEEGKQQPQLEAAEVV